MFNKSGDYNKLKASYDGIVKELSMARNTISLLNEQVESDKDTIEELNGNMESLKTKHSIEVEDLKLAIANNEKSVNRKVNSALASIGVTNFAIETICTVSALTPQEALKQFQALAGGEKTEFYKKHKELINQASLLKI